MPQYLHERPLDDLLENLCRVVATVGRGSAAEKATRDAVARKFADAAAEIDRLKDLTGSLTARVAAQAELLARRAERSAPPG